jgi:glucose/arabinose dehydrogenase
VTIPTVVSADGVRRIAEICGRVDYVFPGGASLMQRGVYDGPLLEAEYLARVAPAVHMKRIYAGGVRNPTGLAFEPTTGKLWAIANERDEIGPDLVPDYLTSVQENGFYGWPHSYWGQHVDIRVQPQRPDLVARAIRPDYGLASHVAPLGMVFTQATTLPAQYRSGVFIGEHGSWDRDPPVGYKVVYVPFSNGRPAGPPQDVVTGFVSEDAKTRGRPVGVALDRTGALLIADDVGNTVWRVSAGSPSTSAAATAPR